jgi:antitoxin ParD1/3/4
MVAVRKTISLSRQQDKWIKAQIKAGHYTNDSEYIRDLNRREQERQAEIDAIRAALIEGENSGEVRSFDAATLRQRAREKTRGWSRPDLYRRGRADSGPR